MRRRCLWSDLRLRSRRRSPRHAVVATEPRAVAASSGPARVTLLSAGASPRSPLRLAITQGAATSASMEFSQSIKQSFDGTPTNAVDLPPTNFVLHATADSVAPNGDAQISYSYSDIEVVDDGSLGTAERAQLEAAYAPLASVTGTGRLTARNQVFDYHARRYRRVRPRRRAGHEPGLGPGRVGLRAVPGRRWGSARAGAACHRHV